MKSNSQVQISSRLCLGDIDGDRIDELVEIDGIHLYILKCNFEHPPLIEHLLSSPAKRLIIGDFVSSGREKGKDQIFAILEDGSIQGWAISDNLKAMWWWFTQPNFIRDSEHFIVGDFDGDSADEILIYDPLNGTIKLYKHKSNGLLGEMSGYSLGNLDGHDLRNKLILAGDFGQDRGRKDILVIDRPNGQVMRFDTVSDAAGVKTFRWAFTTVPHQFRGNDDLIVANLDGGIRDGLLVRNFDTGQYKMFRLESNRGNLVPQAGVNVGQLPVEPHAGRIVAAKVREANLRLETGKARNDIVFFDEGANKFIRTDARFDATRKLFTYWWDYTSYLTVEPNRAAEQKPWAVILCRFKGLPGDPAIEKYFREIFSPGAGGLIEYWHDVSLGAIDISASRVFGWTELDLKRKDAAIGRTKLIDLAIESAQRVHIDPLTGFHKQIAVFTHNFTKDGAPPGTDRRDPAWAPFWIDGSTDGQGRVSAPSHAQSGTFLAHEMGHGFGFDHDLAADLQTPYGDQECIMSAMGVNAFTHPRWNVPFGPTMSFPQLASKNWTLPRRVLTVSPAWRHAPLGTQFTLTAMSDRKIDANIGVILPAVDGQGAWDYYLEYQRPVGWNLSISPRLVIRRRIGNTAAFLGEVIVPTALGGKATWTEQSGQVKFEVEKIRADDRVIRVTPTSQ